MSRYFSAVKATGLMLLAATFVFGPMVLAQSADQGAAASQGSSQSSQGKPLRPRKRLRKALMNKIKQHHQKPSTSEDPDQ